ncbi:tectonin beta-propeller repeat-containing protein 2-like isoform X1 [Huso huso]|uniref:Tectonin beta-propeller repeat-containing protein 2-like isoform X1 n=1 Tax=Huso huso TaxID=61971 RepID=A0ABR0Z1T9_HUSHU
MAPFIKINLSIYLTSWVSVSVAVPPHLAMAANSPPVPLKEFCPLYYLLNAIPAKVQKGFRSVLVYLTALDASNDYIAVGSSIGMLYLYCRRLNQMKKYNLEGKSESITAVKLLSCFDDLVAVGTALGRVVLFQLVCPLPGRNKQLRRFDVVGLHKSTVTALAWSANGMKLFSGDDKGKIVYSSLDLDQGVCNPSVLLEEQAAVVQLDYSHKVLLVSTFQRCLLFYTEHNAVQQIGTKPRKSSGRFGACFHPSLCKQSDLTVYAARPGLRLWKADVRGTVQATFILKDLFAHGVRQFELFPRAGAGGTGGYRPPERQLGQVACFLREGWLLSWNEYSVYLVDSVSQAVIGGLEGSGDIVSVSCTENEIFLLKGDRDLIRISNRPEGLPSIDSASRLNSPLATTPSVLTPTGSVETAQQIRTMSIISEFGDKRTDVLLLAQDDQEPAVLWGRTPESQAGDPKGIVTELSTEPGQKGSPVTSETRSRSSSVNSWDSAVGLGATVDHTASEVSADSPHSSARFSTISVEEFAQELVVKSIKVKKKKKRRQDSGNQMSENSWSEGLFVLEPESDGPSTPVCDFLSDRTSSLDLQSMDSPDRASLVQEDSCSDVFTMLQSPELVSTVPNKEPDTDLLSAAEPRERFVPDSPPASFTPLESRDVWTETPTCLQSEDHELLQRGQECSADNAVPDQSHVQNWESVPGNQTASECYSRSAQSAEDSKPGEATNRWSWSSEGPLFPSTHAPFAGEEAEPPNTSDSHEMYPEDLVNLSDAMNDASECESVRYVRTETCNQEPLSLSSDDEDIYGHGMSHSCSEASVADGISGTSHPGDQMKPSLDDSSLFRSDQFAESWMGYSGPGYGILSLVVSEKYIWCLDFKGGLYCSALPSAGLRWQKYEDNVQQVAVSPSGALLWKIELKTNKAFACAKVTIKGKRHWYEALPQAAFVALSDDTAWIIRTNGDLYLQTGLSIERPCARAVKVDCPCPLSQIASRGNVVWALTEQRAVFCREGLSSFCTEGERWKYDSVSERQGLEPVCISLGDHHTAWALDTNGNLWFRTGVTPKKPQGEDDHWWQVSITDYVVFDQSSLFQTIIYATQTVASAAQAPVEKVADKLRVAFWTQQPQCQPSLISVNTDGVWITSGRNEFHVAKGNLTGTYWMNVVPRGTASATKWAFVFASPAPTKQGSFLWLRQSCKDLFCISDHNPQFRPSTLQLPPDVEMVQLSACQDAVWGLDTHGSVYIRSLSKSCPSGMHWTRLDLSQLGEIKLASFSCGSQNVWACDVNGVVYFRVGTQPLNPSLMLPAWISIEPPEQPVGMHLVSVHSSPNDRMLWAVDSKGNVHVRTGITEDMPVGTDWEHIPGLQAGELAVSSRTVWVRCPNGDVARRYGITDKNPAGDYWKKVPGCVACLTVTPLDELWAISQSGGLIQRLTKTFQHDRSSAKPSGSAVCVQSEDLEEEWEVI